jgi:hypothetical protein
MRYNHFINDGIPGRESYAGIAVRPERLITDPRAVGIIGPPTQRDISYMPIDRWLDARRIPLRVGPAGGQTAEMRRLPLVAAVCRQSRPAAVGSTVATPW